MASFPEPHPPFSRCSGSKCRIRVASLAAKTAIKLSSLCTSSDTSRTVDWISLLATAATASIEKVAFPETLVYTHDGHYSILYTDREGFIRNRNGLCSDYSGAVDDFLFMCEGANKGFRNAYVRGLQFPVIVSVGMDRHVQATVADKEQLKGILDSEEWVLQRYIVPKDLEVRRLFVRWQRTKSLHVYSITPKSSLRATGKDQPNSSKLNAAMIPSLRFPAACEVRKEERYCEDAEINANTVRGLLEKFALQSGEQLEEVVFTLVYGYEGTCYLLNCSRYRVRVATKPKPRSGLQARRQSLDIAGVINRLSKPVPKCFRLMERHSCSLPQLSLSYCCARSPERSPTPSVLVVNQLNLAASSMDKVLQQARDRRKAIESHLKKVRFAHYPDDFLNTVIFHVFDIAKHDRKLSRFFREKEKLIEHIRMAVKEVFMSSRYEQDIRAIHCRLRIGEKDFDTFVETFQAALQAMGADAEDTAQVISYLGSFRSMVVTVHSGLIYPAANE